MADPTQAAAPGLAAPVVPAAAGAGEPGGARRFASVAAVFFENRLAIIGLVVVVAMFAFCFLGPLFYHTDQVHTDLNQVTQSVSLV